MRKIRRLICCTCCIILLFTTISVSAVHLENQVDLNNINNNIIQNIVAAELSEGYSNYYDIKGFSFRFDDTQVVDNELEALVFVSMEVVLKAQDVTELPYVQGMIQRANIDSSSVKNRSGDSTVINAVKDANENTMSSSQMEAVAARINLWCSSLEQYIGKASDYNFYLKVEATTSDGIIDGNAVEIYSEDASGGYVLLDTIFPDTEEQMKGRGIATIEYSMENCNLNQIVSSNAVTYGVADCVEYMVTYTSNPSSCYDHGTTCGTKQDRSKWNNSEYGYYETLCHKDCADYVSQALACYFPEDDIWYANQNTIKRSTPWVNTAQLESHMLERGVFIRYDSDYAPLSAGSVVYTDESHVVMITYADTIGMKYSGHTNDRLNVTFKDSYIDVDINGNERAYNLW